MPQPYLTITLSPTARDMTGRFTKASANIKVHQREMVGKLMGKGSAYAREEAPVGKTGHLQQRIRYRIYEHGNAISGEITSPETYTPFVIRGTRPHMIYGRPLLAFESHGRKVIVHSVHHPGTKANPFMARALARLGPEGIAELQRLAAAVITDLHGG